MFEGYETRARRRFHDPEDYPMTATASMPVGFCNPGKLADLNDIKMDFDEHEQGYTVQFKIKWMGILHYMNAVEKSKRIQQ